MSKPMKLGVALILSAPVVVGWSLRAQTAPPAPLPSQLHTAKTVFLANAGSNGGALATPYIAPAYNTLYRELTASNQYQLVLTPAAADLLLEFSINAFVSDVTQGSSTESYSLQLMIRDAKTQALIWTLAESIEGANRKKTAEKNVTASAIKIAADLKALTSGSTGTTQDASSGPDPQKKTRLSDEGKK